MFANETDKDPKDLLPVIPLKPICTESAGECGCLEHSVPTVSSEGPEVTDYFQRPYCGVALLPLTDSSV